MKTPRVTDFDPDAKTPMLKSSLEKMPAIERPSQKPSPPPQASASVAKYAPKQTPQPSSRQLVRRTFDLFEYQVNYLKHEALQERLDGKDSGMNQMVREAVDQWISKRKTDK